MVLEPRDQELHYEMRLITKHEMRLDNSDTFSGQLGRMLGEGANIRYDFLQRDGRDTRKYVSIKVQDVLLKAHSILLTLLKVIDQLLIVNLMFDVAPKDLYVSSP